MPEPAQKESPKAVETIRIKVDGREVDVPKCMPDWQGKLQPTTMIQACKLAGVEVPHYCYHPKLPVAGNCRMCLIEFGMPKVGRDRQPVLNEDGSPVIVKSVLPYEPQTARGAIACASTLVPGMELYPNSEATKQMREAVLESLLINHPLDCPICDQAGECKLQEYSLEHGQSRSRFVEQKVHKPKQVDLGPRIMLDDERCILCSRCIRFTRDIAGDDALGFVSRGSHSTLTHFPGKPFDNNYTLNTVDLCPVGALTSKDFRFQMRVWFLKETKSICTGCATGCNISIGSREDRILRYEPRENDAVNSCWMCDEGRLNYKWVGREDRLKQVVKSKRGKEPSILTWSEAIVEIRERLRSITPGSVAIVASARQTTEELYLISKLAGRLNAVTDSIPRKDKEDGLLVHSDRNPNANGVRLTKLTPKTLGSRLKKIAQAIEEGEIRNLILFGEDVTRYGIPKELLGKLDLLLVSDILPNASTEMADYLLPGAAHAEKRGTFINSKGRIQKFMQAVSAPGDARAEWEFLGELLEGIVTDLRPFRTIEGLFNNMASDLSELNGLEWASLSDSGAEVAL